ncbi:iron-containing alcohol dehydrogenase [Streptomyces sp. MUM 203J]|uniref:2-deoxy-scyllo-inosose synthase n=1 Tax=Streptomyces sp. MUM 203J TaxID=2791990 RepID=UPI001F04DF96|nr:2-deoxy-scyllo-inosose synthase [Streptomyces sp. MUM 203J]MCH0541478.1 iron-containing alcohol dehydrogenase [Streptomyces sp. MUM 203J]
MPGNDVAAVPENRWQVRQVTIGDHGYPYYYGADCMALVLDELAALRADRFIVVTDDTVLALHGHTLLSGLRPLAPVELVSHRPGESMKTLPTLAADIERVLAAGATRRSVVIALGGGVPGNLAGVIAALLFRGVRLVHIPTTTTAAMDSVLSLKQAINSNLGKNHVGTYLAPHAVFTDVRLLATLPERELRSGLCEAAKNCLAIRPDELPELRRVLAGGRLADPEALLWLLDASVQAKSSVTTSDTREQRTGLVLEYGHTVGHAVELCDHRRRRIEGLSHGEAIAFGMVVAARISHARGWLSAENVALHEEIVGALGAPVRLPAGLSVDDVLDTVRDDNKRGYLPPDPESVPFVLLHDLGKPAGEPELPLVPVALKEIQTALESLEAPAPGPVPDSVEAEAR